MAPLYLARLQRALAQHHIESFSIVLPDGERHKDWNTLNLIFDALLSRNAERKTTLIALGGGVIGDMTGFAAACYQRGAPFIQIPTTCWRKSILGRRQDRDQPPAGQEYDRRLLSATSGDRRYVAAGYPA